MRLTIELYHLSGEGTSMDCHTFLLGFLGSLAAAPTIVAAASSVEAAPVSEALPPTPQPVLGPVSSNKLYLPIVIALLFWVLNINSTFAEFAQDKAHAVAANYARKCYVDMADGQVKCGVRPLRTLASARELLSNGKLISNGEISGCTVNKAVWAFEWRAFPKQTPILVDANTGKLVSCRP
jgi:hypothetical protein